jgi:hypothetical protein
MSNESALWLIMPTEIKEKEWATSHIASHYVFTLVNAEVI